MKITISYQYNLFDKAEVVVCHKAPHCSGVHDQLSPLELNNQEIRIQVHKHYTLQPCQEPHLQHR